MNALHQAENIHFHFNDEQANLLDLEHIVQELSPNTHIYCCGPNPLMLALKEVSVAIGERVHFEWFNAPQPIKSETQSVEDISEFTVKLAKSGHEIIVKPEQSILDAIESHGIEVPFSCRAGICGACECTVLRGEPEHLDMVLSDSEKQANQRMLICVSRSRSPVLELDL